MADEIQKMKNPTKGWQETPPNIGKAGLNEMNKLYRIIHYWDGDICQKYFILADHKPTEAEAVKACEIDLDKDDNESIEIIELEIITLK